MAENDQQLDNPRVHLLPGARFLTDVGIVGALERVFSYRDVERHITDDVIERAASVIAESAFIEFMNQTGYPISEEASKNAVDLVFNDFHRRNQQASQDLLEICLNVFKDSFRNQERPTDTEAENRSSDLDPAPEKVLEQAFETLFKDLILNGVIPQEFIDAAKSEIFESSDEILRGLFETGNYTVELPPGFYVVRQIDEQGNEIDGLLCSINANDLVLHEEVKPGRVANISEHIKAVSHLGTPLSAAYAKGDDPDESDFKDLLKSVITGYMPINIVPADERGISTTIWQVNQVHNQKLFDRLRRKIYLLDGHHRTAASKKAGSPYVALLVFGNEDAVSSAFHRKLKNQSLGMFWEIFKKRNVDSAEVSDIYNFTDSEKIISQNDDTLRFYGVNSKGEKSFFEVAVDPPNIDDGGQDPVKLDWLLSELGFVKTDQPGITQTPDGVSIETEFVGNEKLDLASDLSAENSDIIYVTMRPTTFEYVQGMGGRKIKLPKVTYFLDLSKMDIGRVLYNVKLLNEYCRIMEQQKPSPRNIAIPEVPSVCGPIKTTGYRSQSR